MKLELSHSLVYEVCHKCALDLYRTRLARLNHLHDPQRHSFGAYDLQCAALVRDSIRTLLRSAKDRFDRDTLRIYIRECYRSQREAGNFPPRWQDRTQQVLRSHPEYVPARTMNKLNASIAAGTWLPSDAQPHFHPSTATQSARKPAPATTPATANAGEMGEVAA
jgi:hypothetical protein